MKRIFGQKKDKAPPTIDETTGIITARRQQQQNSLLYFLYTLVQHFSMQMRGSGTVPVMHYEYSQAKEGKRQQTLVGIVQVPFLNPLEPLALIITRLQEQLQPAKIVRIEYLGQKIDLQKNIDIGSLLLDSSQSTALLSVRTKTLQPAIKVFIIKLTALNRYIWVERDSTIEELKQKIQDIEGIPPNLQRYIFSGQQLEDDRTLAEYNIEHGSVLYLILRLRGGGGGPVPVPVPFVDLASNKAQRVQFSSSAPQWRTVSPGTNIEGYCQNRNCEAYKQRVVAREGFGQLNLMTDQFRCPMCCQNFFPTTCGFYSCEWMFVGKKVGQEGIIWGQYTKAGKDHYEWFSESDKKADWVDLVIVSRENQTNNSCTLCLKGFKHMDGDKCVTKCSHQFHGVCIQKFIKIAGRNARCPVCCTMDFMKQNELITTFNRR